MSETMLVTAEWEAFRGIGIRGGGGRGGELVILAATQGSRG